MVCSTRQGRVWKVWFDGKEREVEALPVEAQMCAFNPCAPLCAFALAGHDDKRTPQAVSIYSFHSNKVVDSYEAPSGVADLRWNMQGSELYVLQRHGPLLVYRPDLEALTAELRRPRAWVVKYLRALAKSRPP